MRWSQGSWEESSGFLLIFRPPPYHILTPIMTIPSLEHVTAKTTAPHILQHLHGQADLTLHLCIWVHAAQVDPAVNSWRAQAPTFIKHLPPSRHCIIFKNSTNVKKILSHGPLISLLL